VRRAILACLLILIASPAWCAESPALALASFDRNHDGRLDLEELTDYLVVHDAAVAGDRAKAKDVAADILSALPCQNCNPSMLIRDIVPLLPQETPKKAPPVAKRCKYFGFSRTITDDIDPRRSETDVPAIFSYHRDKHATGDRDNLNAQGTVDFAKCEINAGDAQVLPITYAVKAGVELDVDGSKKKNENSITLGIPVSRRSVRGAKDFITEWLATVSPTFATDRGFDGRDYGLAVDITAWMPAIGAGMQRRLAVDAKGDPTATFFWQPKLSLEWGDVADPAGNEDLIPLKGTYRRVALAVDAEYKPIKISELLVFSVKAVERRDLGHHLGRWYIEPQVRYDVAPDAGVSLTAIFQHGRKPPTFAAKDTWLIGIGIKR
jgi:hypothetical protein